MKELIKSKYKNASFSQELLMKILLWTAVNKDSKFIISYRWNFFGNPMKKQTYV